MRSRLIIFSVLFFVLLPAAPALADNRPSTSYAAQQTPPAQEPGIGVRLLDAPAATQNDPRARSYIVDHLNPGSRIDRRIKIVNGTDIAQDFRLYPSAASVENDAFTTSPGEVQNDLTTWISVDQPAVSLEPGADADVLVSIDVPPDASEIEQYAVVWAEARPSDNSAGGIVNVSRVGVRVYLSVGPGNGPAADFTIDSLTPSRNSEGAPELTTTVANTGGRALDISGSLTLADGPGGLSAGPNPIDKGTTIAPGGSASVSITLPPELPNGPWQATLELESGLVSREAVATITFPDNGQGQTVAPEQGPGVVWIVAGAAVIALAIGGLILWLRQRRASSYASH